jgi:hypothetical protein
MVNIYQPFLSLAIEDKHFGHFTLLCAIAAIIAGIKYQIFSKKIAKITNVPTVTERSIYFKNEERHIR